MQKRLKRWTKDVLVNISEWVPKPYIEDFHYHDYLEIGCCLSGKGSFYFGEKQFDVRPGDVFIVNNLEPHLAQSDADEPCRFLFIYFDSSIIEKEDHQLLMPFRYFSERFKNKIAAELPAAGLIADMLQQLNQEVKKQEVGYQTVVYSLLRHICVILMRHYGAQFSAADFQLDAFRKIQPALTYINSHFREPIELRDVAESVSLSESRTRHLFKEMVGVGFKDYLLKLRVDEAKRLLIGTELSILDIYLQSGFLSQGSFYRAFNKYVGMTPLEYRGRYSLSAQS